MMTGNVFGDAIEVNQRAMISASPEYRISPYMPA